MIELSPVLLVSLGGSLGALGRYWTTRALDAHSFPYGTFVVNALGSFVLGLVAFGGVGGDAVLLVGVGWCGAFTTFSSFAYDTIELLESGAIGRAIANAVGTLAVALAAVAGAWYLVG